VVAAQFFTYQNLKDMKICNPCVGISKDIKPNRDPAWNFRDFLNSDATFFNDYINREHVLVPFINIIKT